MEPRILWSSNINVQLCATAAEFELGGCLPYSIYSKSSPIKLLEKRAPFDYMQGTSFQKRNLEPVYRIFSIQSSSTICIRDIWLGLVRDWIKWFASWGWWYEKFYNLRNP